MCGDSHTLCIEKRANETKERIAENNSGQATNDENMNTETNKKPNII